ncbi:hypothetical protein SAMN04487934_103188 [Eubacterium ruminantium]|nr:hypothetical protein SAMN04487934_103188 [Eubacterium ruminantium]
MKRRLIGTFFLCVICVLMMNTGSKAMVMDIDYSGPLDPVTGDPIGTDEDGTPNRTVISDGSVYDAEEKTYTYTFPSAVISSSAADGMVVTGEVFLEASNNTALVLYKDGEKIANIPESVSESGAYTFTLNSDGTVKNVLSFRIVKKITNALNQYVMPDGFYVKSVYIDGVEQEDISYGSVDMTQEGFYEISYKCSDNQVEYSLDVTVDHTPPDITFKGLGKDNKASGPVTVVGLKPTDTINITFNGKKTALDYDSQLTESGKYRVVITDEAGNRIEKNFRILIYINLRTGILIAIVLAVVIGVGIALYITRKRMRVR